MPFEKKKKKEIFFPVCLWRNIGSSVVNSSVVNLEVDRSRLFHSGRRSESVGGWYACARV